MKIETEIRKLYQKTISYLCTYFPVAQKIPVNPQLLKNICELILKSNKFKRKLSRFKL